jgi:quinol monooxygenase YgiN
MKAGMTAALFVVAVGAVAAAVGTAGLAARCSRAPSLFLGAWTVALFALTVALAAQALGYVAGFSDLTFRAADITAQAIAPLAICLGLAELIAQSIVTRFAVRLVVAAIGVIALVIMASDPLNPNITLSKAWPNPAATYQLVPVGLIKLLAVFALGTALAAGLAVLVRSGRGRDFADVVRPGLTGSAAALLAAVPGVAMLGGTSPSGNGFALALVLAAVLIWLAATVAARRGLAGAGQADSQRARNPSDSGWSDPDGWRGDRYRDDDTGHDDHQAHGYPDEAGYYRPGLADPGLGSEPESDIRYPALAALAAEHIEPPVGYGPEPYESGRHPSGRSDLGGYDPDSYDSGPFDPGVPGYDAAREPYGGGAATGDGEMAGGRADLHPHLFGQITIYTLLEDRIDDFDVLTEGVVEQVRSGEPRTLVYIVHAVPTAPMQRILYEVYQDRDAYDDHLAQPYMIRYVGERRSMVLATNAIELGLQQAKVSPLASYDAISDMLSESGIDLTGVTRSARGTAGAESHPYGRPGSQEWPGPGGDRYPAAGRDEDGHRYGDWDAVRDDDGYR